MTDTKPGLVLRAVLTVDDFDAALRLYRDGLGLTVEETFPGGAVFAVGPGTIEILTRAEAERADRIEAGRPIGAALRLGLQVASSAATGDALEAAGMRRLGGPVTTPWGHRNVRLETPEGVQLTLFDTGEGSA